MGRLAVLWVRLRLLAINALIAVGALGIGYAQWPEAVKAAGYRLGTYTQGLVGTILLAILMAGIPIVIFAVVAHLVLTWLFFARGELERYSTHNILSTVVRETRRSRPDGQEKQLRIFEDEA